MPYKDKDKAKVASKERMRRYRARRNAQTAARCNKGVTLNVTPSVIPTTTSSLFKGLSATDLTLIPMLEHPAKHWSGELTKDRQLGGKGFNR